MDVYGLSDSMFSVSSRSTRTEKFITKWLRDAMNF